MAQRDLGVVGTRGPAGGYPPTSRNSSTTPSAYRGPSRLSGRRDPARPQSHTTNAELTALFERDAIPLRAPLPSSGRAHDSQSLRRRGSVAGHHGEGDLEETTSTSSEGPIAALARSVWLFYRAVGTRVSIRPAGTETPFVTVASSCNGQSCSSLSLQERSWCWFR
jgi:hypothetical protein